MAGSAVATRLGVFVAAYIAYAGVVAGLNVVGRFVRSTEWLGSTIVAVMVVLLLFNIPSIVRGTERVARER
jgi:hypothetical protein